MSKTLETLLKKAKRNSVAIKNGRIVEYDFGQVYKGDLQEQWAIEFNNETNIVELRHWGTVLIRINYITDKPLWFTFYAESRSDVDALNWFFQQFYATYEYHAHYYPSKEKAVIHNENHEVVATS